MNCIEFESAVELAVEMREPLPEAVLAHSKACSHCQQLWALTQQLDQAIGVWRQTVPPVGLIDAVMGKLADPNFVAEPADLSDLGSELRPQPDRLPHDLAPVRRFTRTRLLALACTAVCAAVAMTGFFYSATETAPLVHSEPLPNAIEVATDAPYDVSDKVVGMLSGFRSEYRELASGTSSAAEEIVASIPRRVAESVLPATDDFEIIPDANNVRQILQPIGNRVGSAFSFLLEAVPTEIPAG